MCHVTLNLAETSVVKSRSSVPDWANLFLILPNHIFLIGEAVHLKFHVLFDTEDYYCKNDRLPPKGVCTGSRDLFKFWEISDNMSETVQDRDIVAMKD